MQKTQYIENKGLSVSQPHLICRQFDDCDQLNSIVTTGNVEFIQASKGNFCGTFSRLGLGAITAYMNHLQLKTIANISGFPGYINVFVPLSWEDELIWNGQTYDQSSVFICGSGTDIRRVGINVKFLSYSVNIQAILNRITKLLQESPELFQQNKITTVKHTHAAEIRRLCRHLYRLIASNSADLADASFRKAIDDSLTTATIHAITKTLHRRRRNRESLQSPHKIITTAESYMHDCIKQKIYLSDICQAVGTSERTIEYAFKKTFNTTPLQYLKLYRLRQVRTRLREADPAETSVKAIALEYGFWEMGRFAADYKRLFCESPSDTLKQC